MAKDSDYKELSRAKTKNKRNIVISQCAKGGFAIAQQLEVQEEQRTMNVFLKGAFFIDDIQGLLNLRDALNVAIEKVETSKSSSSEENDWDE